MKLVTQEEINALELKTSGPASSGKALMAYSMMNAAFKQGESLVITRHEWPIKGAPSSSAVPLRLRQYLKIKVRSLADDAGWLVTRV